MGRPKGSRNGVHAMSNKTIATTTQVINTDNQPIEQIVSSTKRYMRLCPICNINVEVDYMIMNIIIPFPGAIPENVYVHKACIAEYKERINNRNK